MSDADRKRRNAERQRRYIARLKAAAVPAGAIVSDARPTAISNDRLEILTGLTSVPGVSAADKFWFLMGMSDDDFATAQSVGLIDRLRRPAPVAVSLPPEASPHLSLELPVVPPTVMPSKAQLGVARFASTVQSLTEAAE